MIFITDYHRINEKLVRNPYLLPRIVETMQQLEGLQYAATIDPNMEKYAIRLSPARQDTPSIVTKFGKLRYNNLLMGMCAPRYIFQAKVDNILGDIEFFKTYIDYILVLSKDCFIKHTEQLRMILCRLHASGLTVNAPKCSFGLRKFLT